MTDTTPATTTTAREIPAAVRTGEALQKALTTAGLVNDDGTIIVCPQCGKPAPVGKKFKLFPDGGYKHFSAGGCYGDAISVLRARFECSFGDAVRYLSGQSTRFNFPPASTVNISVDTFTATCDTEVYTGMYHYGYHTRIKGDVYAQARDTLRHIDPASTTAFGVFGAPDPDQMSTDMIARFGIERLLKAGVFILDRNGEPRLLMNVNYDIAEPHHHPDGRILFLQFRASLRQRARIAAHEAGNGKYPGGKFLSIRGAHPDTQVGIGLHLIAAAPAQSRVVIVEGGTDARAGHTMGALTFGIPGVDHRPGALALETLKPHKVEVALDGDAAGAAHTQALAQYLRDNGVNDVSVRTMPDGHDVNDILIKRHVDAGCLCTTCAAYRQRFTTDTKVAS